MAKQAQLDAVRPVLNALDKELDNVEKVLDSVDKIVDKGADAVSSGLEKIADVVPDALDTSAHVSTRGIRKLVEKFRNPRVAGLSVVGLSMATGAGLGVAAYFTMVKRVRTKLQAEFDERLESEIAEMRRFYALRNKDGEFATPQAAVEALLTQEAATALSSYQGKAETVELKGEPEIQYQNTPSSLAEGLTVDERVAAMKKAGYTDAQIAEVLGTEYVDLNALQEKMRSGQPIEVVEDSTHNIFVEGRALEEFDYEAEVAKRDPNEPYVITHDEFMENENDFTQNTLTYYNGDDVLADESDMPITDIETTVGSENLTKFGYGSKDSKIVYVRNERIETDFEIALSMGEFAKEVAGFQHSAPLRRFRGSDDN